jgi:polyisoprenoid-binding protein YceI
MKLHRTAVLLFATTLGPAVCAQTVLPEQSEVAFTTRQMGVPVEGRFKRWSATLQFDPRQPQAAKVDFSIDTRSVTFGAAETELEVAKPGWFDSARFPQARFVSNTVRAVGGNRFEVLGSLTLKGVTRDLTVPVTLAPAAGGLSVASGSFTLRRLEFRIGDGDWNDPSLVADEVQVRLRLTLSGLAAR